MKLIKILSVIMVGILLIILGGCQLFERTSEISSEVVSESVISKEKDQVEAKLTENIVTVDENLIINVVEILLKPLIKTLENK